MEHRARPMTLGRKRFRYWPVAMTVAVGAILSAWMAAFVGEQQAQQREQHFRQQAENAAAAVRAKLRDQVEVLYSVRDLYGASTSVTRRDFERFASGQRSRQSGIQALEWIPRVRDAERAAFERAARADGMRGFTFTEALPDGRLRPARRRAEYFPVYYVTPLRGNERALGYAPDLPVRDAAIHAAIRTGREVATGRFRLVQESKDGFGLALFVPVYDGATVPGTPAARQEHLVGLVEGVLRLDDMMRAAVEGLDLTGLRLTVLDQGAPPADRLLATWSSADSVPPAASPTWQDAFDMGGRRWLIRVAATPAFPQDPLAAPWSILGVGLLVTGLGGAYLFSLMSRGAQIAAQVDVRTQELSRATQELRRSEAIQRAVITHATDTIFIKDLEGRYLLVNPEGCRVLGLPLERIVGARDVDLFPPEVAELLRRVDRAAIERGQPETHLQSLDTPEGRRVFLITKFPYLSDAGAILGVIGLARDVTDYNRAIEEVAHREAELAKVREMDRLKSNFVSSVSHDLRTPLTSIKGYAEFLEDGIGGELSPQQQEFVAQIARGTRRLENLVDDLLDFARFDAGTFTLRRDRVEVGALLREMAESMQPQCEENRLTLHLELPSEPLWASFDQQRIERVLANLLSNAIKFTPPGGTIRLAAERIPGALRCSVTDSGPGIAPADQAKLFQRFSQLATGLHKGGTGLGLSISKAIIEAHRGQIAVESRPGAGATFWFTLPDVELVREEVHHAPDHAHPGQ